MHYVQLTRLLSRALAPTLPIARRPSTASLVLVCAAFLVAPSTASAAPITVPPSLLPGSQYRLAFETSTTTHATSTNIADYNTFVDRVANVLGSPIAGLSSWTAIGSTATVNAMDNTSTNPVASTGLPIYNLAGNEVAANNTQLWQGTLLAPIEYTENGIQISTSIWTGNSTTIPGTSAGINALGQVQGQSTVYFGLSSATSSFWQNSTSSTGPLSSKPMYALSGVLTVPAPEPSSMVLAGLAAAGLAVPMLRRRRNGRR
jgi:hypothetical protein